MNRNLSYNAGNEPNKSKKKNNKRAPKSNSEFSPFHVKKEAAPSASPASSFIEEPVVQPVKEKRLPKKKKKGCLSPFIFLIILLLGAVGGSTLLLQTAFRKVENYPLNKSEISTVDEDPNMKDFQTIALFGVDDQDNEIHEKGSRTDSIVLFSINTKTREAKMLSIYRDTYVSINGQYDKINAAHSYGGPELALSTINRNLDLNITDFATINFKALADAVNILGGVELTVKSETELENLNNYIGDMNRINGGDSPQFDPPASFPFSAVFDGNQAVAYSRIRYMAGGDHERANHQRIVIGEIYRRMTHKPWKIPALINTVLPQCKTSMSSKDLAVLTKHMIGCKIVDSSAYPFEGHSVDYKYNGVYYGFPITVVDNVVMAHEYLFSTKNYQPSEELQEISWKVQQITDNF